MPPGSNPECDDVFIICVFRRLKRLEAAAARAAGRYHCAGDHYRNPDVQMWGSTVHRSEPGHGPIFFVELPVQAGSAAATQPDHAHTA